MKSTLVCQFWFSRLLCFSWRSCYSRLILHFSISKLFFTWNLLLFVQNLALSFIWSTFHVEYFSHRMSVYLPIVLFCMKLIFANDNGFKWYHISSRFHISRFHIKNLFPVFVFTSGHAKYNNQHDYVEQKQCLCPQWNLPWWIALHVHQCRTFVMQQSTQCWGCINVSFYHA